MPLAPEPPATGPVDWLGYGQYAQALWSRIAQGFAQESARRRDARDPDEPAADPLVVGLYGEWGVGKSRLLELIYQLAANQSAQECARRVLDPAAWNGSQALRLTIPVWFHPWKYEHEQHLAVPMLMHIADAMRTRLRDGTTLAERTKEEITRQATALGQTAEEVSASVGKGVRWIRRVAKVTHEIAGNELVKTVTGVAAGFVGMSGVTDRGLDWIAETSGKLAGRHGDDEDDDDDEDEEHAGGPDKDKAAKKSAKDKPASRNERIDARPTHSVDGRYYYNIQKYLRELTCITPKSAREHGMSLRHDVHLNFVVFVDDLDRCLPEKAVEVLEVIKTLLNIEHFAFVVALDDEVIERGISHRYRDYRFEGAKPEMPITGFEYLEKIVHLPFRLPQLTRAQAASFILQHENRMVEAVAVTGPQSAPAPRLWYVAAPATTGTTPDLQPTSLVPLLLDSFEAFVPRKLTRTLELMNQFQQVFAARGTPMQVGTGSASSTAIDARMVLFTILMQLFAPEVFRLIRRRPETFGQWLRAHLPENTMRPAVFEWRKASIADPLVLEVSDADLYRWAALGSQANIKPMPDVTASDSPADGTRSAWSDYLRQYKLSQSDRHSIEQLRLPFATAISDYRGTQRHAFSPLRLGAGMAYAMGWSYELVPGLQSYLQLTGASVSLAGAGTTVTTGHGTLTVSPEPARKARAVNVRDMLDLIASPDAATRASLIERLGLLEGETIDEDAIAALAGTLSSNAPESAEHLLAALALLEPHLDRALIERHTWTGLGQWRFGSAEHPSGSHGTDEIMDAAAPYARLHALGLATPLQIGTAVRNAMSWILSFAADFESVDTPRRARAGDLLAQFQDPRFDAAAFGLPSARALVRESPDRDWRETTYDEERIPGFVRVPKGSFNMGKRGGGTYEPLRIEHIETDFFIARTPVTVDQFAQFVNAGGYRKDNLWDATGIAWKEGQFDSAYTDEWFKARIRERPPENRLAPQGWELQRPFGNRPVGNINWFEARAYARWLDERLRSRIDTHLTAKYHVMLLSERQWERAARASGLHGADERLYPWGNDAHDIGSRANVASSALGKATPVGCFEATLLGLSDMVGNVGVWTDNLFLTQLPGRLRKDPTFRQTNAEADVQKDDLIVARGSGWNVGDDFATCTYRHAVPPDDFNPAMGMRLVLSSS
jgi:formylglycine-generating enzyme required for sulfatase activity